MKVRQRIIDVHAHVIPGVDDGSRTMEESVEMLKRAADQGIVGVIATPHYSRRHVLKGLNDSAKLLQQEIRKTYPKFRIFPGQETFYHDELAQILPQLSVFAFLYYRTYSIINISKNMGEAVRCQVHTVHYV